METALAERNSSALKAHCPFSGVVDERAAGSRARLDILASEIKHRDQMAEVEAGHMAQEKGASQAVKDFGAMMVKDHTAANNKLMKIAASAGVKSWPKAASRQRRFAR